MNDKIFDLLDFNYEKNFGLNRADLLVLELGKPMRPIISKNDNLKNSSTKNSNLFALNQNDDMNYRNPKVRLNIK